MPDPERPALRVDPRLAYALFIASGATGLVYEVTWFRHLSLIFGASFGATSIVLAAFMAGMSLGGFVFGRLGDRIARPLRAYGLIEVGIGLFALALPHALRGVDAIYVGLARGDADAGVGLAVLRATLAFLVLATPTVLMGATLPIMTRLLVHARHEFGRRLSWLYGSNTLGAVIGTLAAGFVMIPTLGVAATQWVAVGVNVAVGVIALVVDARRAPTVDVAPSGRVAAQASADAVDAPPSGLADPAGLSEMEVAALRLVFVGTFVSGFASFALEVLWTRAISAAVGSSTYSFSIMLAAFLIGIALGSALHAARPIGPARLPLVFGAIFVAVGATSLLASVALPGLPERAIELNLALYGDLSRIRPLTTFLVAFGMMVVPCVLIGIAFPMANEARRQLARGTARSVGETLGLNTFGSIAGSLAAGYLLIPFVGLGRGMVLAAGLYLGWGLVVLGLLAARAGSGQAPARRALVLASAGALVALLLAQPLLSRDASRTVLGTFSNNQLGQYLQPDGEIDVEGELAKGFVRYYREGRASTVSVLDQDGFRSLSVNGKIVASDDPEDLRTQYMLAHVPILMAETPRSALVIGMGAGTTLGAVVAHDDLESIALAEIEPAILGAEPHFGESNGRPLSDPRLRVYLEDGRNFLKTTTRTFDVITADPIHPWTRGSGYLYTEEYYRLAAERLTPGGVMCQWLPVADLTPEDFKSVVATFAEVFPDTTLWHSTSAILIGRRRPVETTLEALTERMSAPRVEAQLARLGLAEPLAFLAERRLDDDQVRAYSAGAVVNTDDNLYLEFSSPLAIGADRQVWSVVRELYDFTPSGRPLAEGDPDRERLAAWQRAKRRTALGTIALRSPIEERRRRGLAALEGLARSMPAYRPARMVLADYLIQRAGFYLERRMLPAGLADAARAAHLDPTNARAQLTLARLALASGERERAQGAAERAREIGLRDWHALVELADVFSSLERRGAARAVLSTAQSRFPGVAEIDARLRALSDG